jgi:hypothetical protein
MEPHLDDSADQDSGELGLDRAGYKLRNTKKIRKVNIDNLTKVNIELKLDRTGKIK